MIAVGALCLFIGAGAAVAAARRDTAVQRRLGRLAPIVRRGTRWRPVEDRDLRQAGLARTQTEVVAAKAVGLLLGAMAGALGSGVLGAAPIIGAAGAYAGFVGPSIAIERRAAASRRRAERALGPLLERLEALASAGRPVEPMIVALARVPTGAPVLDRALSRSTDAYALGAPLLPALAAEAKIDGLPALAELAAVLERARDLGQGTLTAIREARDAARAEERTAALAAAATVEGKLMITLVLCYLPALMLLVVVPLFLTLLDGLFG